jgi:hypothetical protein
MVTRLHTLLKGCKVRMIFVDEFQHTMDRETQRVLNAVADFLKDIINQSNIPMILIGQQGEAEPILLTNPQLSRRVGTPRYLKPFPWEQADPETTTEFCTIMESIDLELPFDPSGLGERDMAFRFPLCNEWLSRLDYASHSLCCPSRYHHPMSDAQSILTPKSL